MVIEFLFFIYFIYFGVVDLKLRGGDVLFIYFACSLVLLAECKIPVYRATFFVSMFIYQKKKKVIDYIILQALNFCLLFFTIIFL